MEEMSMRYAKFMKKFFIQFTALVLIILAVLYVTYNPALMDSLIARRDLTTNTGATQGLKQLKIANTIIKIEIADTADLRTKGLGGRASLDADKGMLFIFPTTKKYQFWMKGLSFPLDFIWITNGRVVDLLKNIPAPATDRSEQNLPIYEPIMPVNQMLEVNAGFVDAYNIQVGDSVEVLP